MNETTLTAIRSHAAQEYPRECCGVIIVARGKERYVPCRNLAKGNDHFVISPEDYADAEDAGTITHIVHSHPNESPRPSPADLVSCEESGLPWLIVNWPTGICHEFSPTGYVAPLVGRKFFHGVLDCYALIRDYYAQVVKIDIPNYHRDDDWWLRNQNLYLDNFGDAGFVEVNGPVQLHDVLLMQIASPVPNHAAVYIGDGLIMQHLANRISSKDVYGGFYQKCTAKIVRHRSLL